jgi:hypothetical protein
MIDCFGCGRLIDVSDRYCRWCGRTFIPDNYGPVPPQAAGSTACEIIQEKLNAAVSGWTSNTDCNGIALVLTRGIFHDDEDELNDVMELIEYEAMPPQINQGY